MQTSPATSAASNTDLRGELEAVYNAARASVDEPTSATYFTLVEESTHDAAKVATFNERWTDPETKKALQNFLFSDLKLSEFVEIKQEGDWAGYFDLSDLDQKDRVNVRLFRFHRVNGKWMAYPKTSMSSEIFDGGDDEALQAAAKNIIETSDLMKVIPS